MCAEGGELEGGRPRVDQLTDACRTFLRIDRGVEGEIRSGLGAGLGRFGAKALRGRDQAAVVIRHVDDGRDAAGERAARRPDEVFLALLAAAVHLRIDRSGKHKKPGAPMPFASRRRRGADSLHQAVGDQNIAVADDPIGQDDRSREDLIGHGPCLPSDVVARRRRRVRHCAQLRRRRTEKDFLPRHARRGYRGDRTRIGRNTR